MIRILILCAMALQPFGVVLGANYRNHQEATGHEVGQADCAGMSCCAVACDCCRVNAPEQPTTPVPSDRPGDVLRVPLAGALAHTTPFLPSGHLSHGLFIGANPDAFGNSLQSFLCIWLT